MIAPHVSTTDPTVAPMPRWTAGITDDRQLGDGLDT